MIKFGPSGNCKRFYDEGHKSTLDAPKWCADQGLNVYEYSFGRGINIGDEKAQAIGDEGKKYGVEITVHAPYYINFANPSMDMVEKSFNYVLNSAFKAKVFGGNRIVFHPASVGKMERSDAVALAAERLNTLAALIVQNKLDDCYFCPETMGRINQIGDLQEIVEFCKLAEFYLPAIDFGHLNARTHGSLKTEEDYEQLIKLVINELGFERASKMHVHFSKIEYGKGGEVRHLTFADQIYGPEFLPLAKVIKKYGLSPVIICESDGTQADDALTMKATYENL